MTLANAVLTQFETDLREQILSSLPHDAADRPSLEAMQLPELLVRYLNWMSRYVAARPRRVHVSAVLAGKRPLPDIDHDHALADIVSMLEAGSDITAHLSRGVSVGVDLRPAKSRAKRRDLDLMLNDWGVHHLHISLTREADGFVTRTGPVLFAAFQSDDAYLIDVVEHGRTNPDAWTTTDTLRIMARDWPAADLVAEMKGALRGSKPWTNSERREIRAAGGASWFDLDGKVFTPRMGLTTAGTATMTTLRANRLLKHMRILAEEISTGRGHVWETLRGANISIAATPDFRPRVFIDGYGLAEETSQTFIWMGRW